MKHIAYPLGFGAYILQPVINGKENYAGTMGLNPCKDNQSLPL